MVADTVLSVVGSVGVAGSAHSIDFEVTCHTGTFLAIPALVRSASPAQPVNQVLIEASALADEFLLVPLRFGRTDWGVRVAAEILLVPEIATVAVACVSLDMGVLRALFALSLVPDIGGLAHTLVVYINFPVPTDQVAGQFIIIPLVTCFADTLSTNICRVFRAFPTHTSEFNIGIIADTFAILPDLIDATGPDTLVKKFCVPRLADTDPIIKDFIGLAVGNTLAILFLLIGSAFDLAQVLILNPFVASLAHAAASNQGGEGRAGLADSSQLGESFIADTFSIFPDFVDPARPNAVAQQLNVAWLAFTDSVVENFVDLAIGDAFEVSDFLEWSTEQAVSGVWHLDASCLEALLLGQAARILAA